MRNSTQGYLLKTIDGDLLASKPFAVPRRGSLSCTAGSSWASWWRPSRSQGAPSAASAAPAPEVAEASGSAASDSGTPLSPREEEVLREIARGMSNKEIARVLDIAETTVKIHPAHPAQARPDLARAGGGVRIRPPAREMRPRADLSFLGNEPLRGLFLLSKKELVALICRRFQPIFGLKF